MTEWIQCLTEKMTGVVKGREKGVDLENGRLRENVPESDLLGGSENGPLAESDVLFLATRCSFRSFL